MMDGILISNGINPMDAEKEVAKNKLSKPRSSGGECYVIDSGVKKKATPEQARRLRALARNPVEGQLKDAGFAGKELAFWTTSDK